MNLKNYSDYHFYKVINLYLTSLWIVKKEKIFYIDYFCLYMHKKLNYYQFSFDNKHYNHSNGQLLGKRVKKFKYIKKSKKTFSYVIKKLNKKLVRKLNSIDIFFVKNYNFKNYFWLKKYFYIIKPTINYMFCTNSWNYVTIGRKRIKKKIYRNLVKQSK